MINGAQTSNVFWIAEGAISLNTTNEMKGTFISNNGAISMASGGHLEGRLLTTAGAASLTNVIITIPNFINIPLPISLISFSGYCEDNSFRLNWTTASEINNAYFTIERSLDGHNWSIVDLISGSNNSTIPIDYSLTDRYFTRNVIYYLLKQTDFNGRTKNASLISIQNCAEVEAEALSIFPNPSNGNFEIKYNGTKSDLHSIQIINSQGKVIYQTSSFQSSFDLRNQTPGVYYVQILQNTTFSTLKMIVLNE